MGMSILPSAIPAARSVRNAASAREGGAPAACFQITLTATQRSDVLWALSMAAERSATHKAAALALPGSQREADAAFWDKCAAELREAFSAVSAALDCFLGDHSDIDHATELATAAKVLSSILTSRVQP